ncbi:helicase-exonuclease AddAB subunit AddB [Clostridium sp. YIM B02515]|uniref:ATP-dependent helicase/deoxyribonuclease subunit B n=1 Tax=Clostridium rhizosphaerae TaxID=2803861 RepID=A0ABS1T919_9CLOT|nr:helicase-exonuclease AddAB subunit AddB [Clostridium rhizosphaerae]MBL4935838.1 helicase-exonuclease AddAB subunit AddB [Clostridium rhizosphaerae]
MSLQFIFGRSGSGKSTYCLENIKDKLSRSEYRDKKLVYLVPEQFTFQADRNLVEVIGEKGIHRVQVLSFTRMAYVVFNEVGGITRLHMNSAGRNMLLYKIIEEVKEKLTAFNRVSKQAGFINVMSETITELKRYNINPELLNKITVDMREDDQLKGKLKDINLIFERFETFLHEKYIDNEDQLSMLVDKLDSCNLFDESEIWIDEFSTFTPIQYNIIEKLLKKADKVNITLTTDCLTNGKDVDNTDVFAAIKNTETKLLKLLKENNIPYEKPICLNDDMIYRFRESKELNHLERYIFNSPYKTYNKETENLKIFRALNMYSEIQNTARDIIGLCRNQKLRFKDIAVVTRNLQGYEKIIQAIFTEYNIPYFLDKRRDINNNPLIILLNSVIDIFTKNWSYEAVFRYLKTGLTDIDIEEIDIIENYVLANGIRGKKWFEEQWDYGINYKYDASEEEEENLKKINDIKIKVTNSLFILQEKLKGKNSVRKISEALFEFLEEIKAYEKVEYWVERFKQEKELDKANEYSQVWNLVIELLDQLVEVLGEEEVKLEEFVKILATGINEYDIGVIPAALDQVLIGDIERVKSHEVSAIFLIGVNDKVFPKAADEEGILNDRDREYLKSLGVELAADTKAQAFEEQFLIYRSLSMAGKFLRISYPIADVEGRSMRPSIIISKLKKVFPKIVEESDVIKNDTDEESLEQIAGEDSTFNELIAALRSEAEGKEVSTIWWDAYRWYMNKPKWRERCRRAFAGLSYSNQVQKVSSSKIKKLYGNPLQFSVSRLERYASCPFAYYVQYGLKAKDRKVYEFSMPDLGTFVHEVLDEFSEVLDKEKVSFREVEDNFVSDAISMIIDEKIKEKTGFILNSSPRYKFMAQRLKKILTRSVDIISEQIKRSNFNPTEHEVDFSAKGKYPPITIKLPSGEQIELMGRIDRVDELETEEGTFIRIVDYKSGNKGFKLSDVYYGLQLQLLVYLDAILSNKEKYLEKGVFPGAVLYFRVEDPMINSEGELSQDKIEEKILKELKMRGLLLKNIKVIKDMDKELESGYSLIVPAQILKGGEIGEKTSGATLEQFETLRKYVRKIVIDLCEEMLQGNISIKPYKKKKNTPCEYCNFASICQFDTSISDNKYKIINDKNNDEVWELMRKEVEEVK